MDRWCLRDNLGNKRRHVLSVVQIVFQDFQLIKGMLVQTKGNLSNLRNHQVQQFD